MTDLRRTVFALALALFASPLAAQVRDTAAVADSAAVLPLPALFVTGTRTPLRADRVGFAVSALDGVALAKRRPAYVAEALRALPGAFIDEAAGPGGPTIVRLRGGEEVFTQVLVDGVQINENGGFFDFQGLALSNLDRIEVARGPQSALYGSSAVSGVVHFLTRRGTPGPPRAELLAEGGGATENGGAWRATGSVAGGSEVFRYSAGGGAAYNRGIYELPHDTHSRDASLRLDFVPSDRFDANVTARWMNVDGHLPVRDPGATRVPLDPNARNERTRIVASAGARFDATDRWAHELRASLYREDFFFGDRFDDVDTEDLDFFVFDANIDFENEPQRATVEYGGAYRIGDLVRATGATLSYGAQWQEERLAQRSVFEGSESALTLDRENVAGFAEVAYRPHTRLDLLAGVRAEAYEELETAWTPRASVVFAAVPDVLALRAAAGTAYKAPNLQQQYVENQFIESNPDLEPETSTSWEVGGDARIAGGRATLGLTFFTQRFQDLIRTVQSDDDPSKGINRNLGEAEALGIEWSVAVRPASGWTVGSEGAWIRTEVVDNVGLPADAYPAGEELPFRPSVSGSVFAELARGDVTVRARALFVGAQTVLTERFSGRRERIDPYTLLGFTGNWAFSRSVGLYVRADNLLGVDYQTAFDRRGIPVTGAVGLRLTR
jgi:vitamin B12 transporter